MKTLLSLWIMVIALLLGSVGGGLWIRGENEVLAVILLIGTLVLFVASIFIYAQQEQRVAQDVRHPVWWIHKAVNHVLSGFAAFFFMFLLLKDFRFSLMAACALLVMGFLKSFLEWKRLSKASPQ